MKFFSTSNTSVQRCLYPYFKISNPIFCCPLFSENYHNPQVRINKMVNKHTVDYHPSHSQLIWRIHAVIFLWTPKWFVSPESFLDFFLSLHIPLWLRESFKFIVLRLLANTFVSTPIFFIPPSKTLPQVFIITPRQKEITHYSWTAFSEDLFFPSRKGAGYYGVEEITKIKPTRVLVTSFDKFHHPCNLYIYIIGFCFLCHNLASSMLKCEGSLT